MLLHDCSVCKKHVKRGKQQLSEQGVIMLDDGTMDRKRRCSTEIRGLEDKLDMKNNDTTEQLGRLNKMGKSWVVGVLGEGIKDTFWGFVLF